MIFRAVIDIDDNDIAIDIDIEKANIDTESDLCHMCCLFLLPFCPLQFLVCLHSVELPPKNKYQLLFVTMSNCQ